MFSTSCLWNDIIFLIQTFTNQLLVSPGISCRHWFATTIEIIIYINVIIFSNLFFFVSERMIIHVYPLPIRVFCRGVWEVLGGVNSIHKYIHVHNLKIGLFISPACLFVCFLTETLTCFDNSNFISKLKKNTKAT